MVRCRIPGEKGAPPSSCRPSVPGTGGSPCHDSHFRKSPPYPQLPAAAMGSGEKSESRVSSIKIHLQPDAATFQLVQPLYVTQAFVTFKMCQHRIIASLLQLRQSLQKLQIRTFGIKFHQHVKAAREGEHLSLLELLQQAGIIKDTLLPGDRARAEVLPGLIRCFTCRQACSTSPARRLMSRPG